MKLTTCLTFCIILFLECSSANGHIKDLFDGVHNKLHKVREDIHNIVFPSQKEPNSEQNAWSQPNYSETKKSEINVSQDVKQVEVTTQTTTTDTVINFLQPETTSTTEKGKENFGATCLPGYIRTPDGRCKASF